MKTIQGSIRAVIGTVLICGMIQCASAIEGLQLFLQCSNVVLTWPSVDGDTYIIQRRADLTTNSSWICLTNSFPATSGTNITVFTDYGIVSNANCAGSGLGPVRMALSTMQPVSQSSTANRRVLSTRTSLAPPPPPLPPSPTYQYSRTATGAIVRKPVTSSLAVSSSSGTLLTTDTSGPPQVPGPVPNPPTNDTPPLPPDGQFYEVVKVGVHLFGITNGMVLSGTVPLNVEFGNTDTNGTLVSLSVADANDDSNVVNGIAFPYIPNQPSNLFAGSWNTTWVSNGNYTLQLVAMLDDGTVYTDHPVTVTVSNLAWLPDPWNAGGAALYIGVQTPYHDGNGTWRVDAYDDQGTHIGYIPGIIDTNGYLSYSGNPNVGFSVNNTDSSGNQLPSTGYTLVYSADVAHPLSKTPPYTFTNQTLIEYPWNFAPTWGTTCYVDVFGINHQSAQADAQVMMQGVFDGDASGHPQTIGYSTTPFLVDQTGPFSVVLDNLIADVSRDFLYFGHGSPDYIGYSLANSLNST
ncbi:MAG: hypothetical protein JWQ04_462, partial [Pedosphaera sp.]|nr:hypothetical protein [Pedosphaera sp.]